MKKYLSQIAPYIIITISIINTIINSNFNKEIGRIVSLALIIFTLILFIFIAYINKPLEKNDKIIFLVTLIISGCGLIYIAF
ncbi:hypothetical protein ABFP60_18480 [Clostridioides difficile]